MFTDKAGWDIGLVPGSGCLTGLRAAEQPLLCQPYSSQVHFVTDSPVFEVVLKAVRCFNGTDSYRPWVE